jgi:hypothetical protein
VGKVRRLDLVTLFSGTTLGSVQTDEIKAILVSALASITVILANALINWLFSRKKTDD